MYCKWYNLDFKFYRDDGCFVARMIGMNSTDMVITDLLDCMWRNYRLREEPKQPEYPLDDEEAKLLEKEKDRSPLDFRGNNVQWETDNNWLFSIIHSLNQHNCASSKECPLLNTWNRTIFKNIELISGLLNLKWVLHI